MQAPDQAGALRTLPAITSKLPPDPHGHRCPCGFQITVNPEFLARRAEGHKYEIRPGLPDRFSHQAGFLIPEISMVRACYLQARVGAAELFSCFLRHTRGRTQR